MKPCGFGIAPAICGQAPGRHFVRVLDSIQLTAKHKVATPANWRQGGEVIIAGSVGDEDARKLFPQGWKAPRSYLRITRLAS